ncbi:hypothetical protein [Idiomarina xiamenensis]|uniref:2TM domain-containing protein n=1 Tax=Idiomarina xiamenensis 10-D-4 TaxID=740709 RepID=K2KDD5_9GAMM|nr:hypothetical protein [Idiomarina xiamenensis]EKE84707.1 hypothetical protein A10D4_03815 [Idiomarina xiamenensis 10-D-4]
MAKQTWNATRISYWQKQRAAGKWRFVRKYGARWGILMFIAFMIFHLITRVNFNSPDWQAQLWASIITNLITWSIGGLLFGLVVWYTNERSFRRFQQQQQASSASSDSSTND